MHLAQAFGRELGDVRPHGALEKASTNSKADFPEVYGGDRRISFLFQIFVFCVFVGDSEEVQHGLAPAAIGVVARGEEHDVLHGGRGSQIYVLLGGPYSNTEGRAISRILTFPPGPLSFLLLFASLPQAAALNSLDSCHAEFVDSCGGTDRPSGASGARAASGCEHLSGIPAAERWPQAASAGRTHLGVAEFLGIGTPPKWEGGGVAF